MINQWYPTCVKSADHDPAARTEAREHPAQGWQVECDASRGGGETRSRHVNEHCAAAACHPRAGVVIKLDDKIVQGVGPGETVGPAAGRHPNRPVVAAVGGILAPAVVCPNGAGRQERRRPGVPIGAPPQPHEAKPPARRAAVPLPFVGLDAAATQGGRQGKGTGNQPAPPGIPGLAPYRDAGQCSFLHCERPVVRATASQIPVLVCASSL